MPVRMEPWVKLSAFSFLVVLIMSFGFGAISKAQENPAKAPVGSDLTLQLSRNSNKEIVGTVNDLGIRFTARRESTELVTIVLLLSTQKRIDFECYPAEQDVAFRVVNTLDGQTAGLTGEEIRNFQKLLPRVARAVDQSQLLGDLLVSTINYISNAPRDVPLARPKRNGKSSSGASNAPSPTPQGLGDEGIISLCGQLNSEVWVQVFLESTGGAPAAFQRVGDCFKVNDSFGRCGSDIGPDPWPVGYKQEFTQDCADHDYCCRLTGGSGDCGSDCSVEYFDAADDFLWAPDCSTMQGNWFDDDPYLNRYSFTGGDAGSENSGFSGQAYATCCGTYGGGGFRSAGSVRDLNFQLFQSYSCAYASTWNGAFQGCNQIYFNVSSSFPSGSTSYYTRNMFRGEPSGQGISCGGFYCDPHDEYCAP